MKDGALNDGWIMKEMELADSSAHVRHSLFWIHGFDL